jgi:hypothetical protein
VKALIKGKKGRECTDRFGIDKSKECIFVVV